MSLGTVDINILIRVQSPLIYQYGISGQVLRQIDDTVTQYGGEQ